jgi:CheY-like chemotaxis protein
MRPGMSLLLAQTASARGYQGRRMDPHRAAIVFIGDLSDPWVVDIAQALPASQGVDQIDCRDDLPELRLDPSHPPRLIIVHRHRLSGADLLRLREWRQPAPALDDEASAAGPPAIFLCISPFVRYDELTRCSGQVDLVVSEAEAALVLPRRVSRLLGTEIDRTSAGHISSFRIEVAGGNAALCDAVAEACSAAGYNARSALDLPAESTRTLGQGTTLPAEGRASGESRVLTIWEVPVLEPDWSERLARRALTAGPVIALIGFADRTTVTQAKSAGAVACLDLPSRVDDLLDVIDQVVAAG